MSILRPFHPRAFVLENRATLDKLKALLDAAWEQRAAAGQPLEVVVAEWKAKRSTAQNALYWKRVQQIADHVWIEGRQFSAETWHEMAKRTLIGVIDLPKGGVTARSSAGLTVQEFSEYVTRLEQWAAEEFNVQFTD